jgi:uncharacterized protein YcbK (DUF882 family)
MTQEKTKQEAEETKETKLSETIKIKDLIHTNVKGEKIGEKQLQGAIQNIDNLRNLATNILEPIIKNGFHITINSGYRCSEVNKQVNGAINSQHTKGQAADIANKELKELFEYIKNNLRYDQLIIYKTFLHVSYNEEKNRRQILDYTKTK